MKPINKLDWPRYIDYMIKKKNMRKIDGITQLKLLLLKKQKSCLHTYREATIDGLLTIT